MYLFVLSVLYFVTRIWNLTILPIFTDESIYIYWAKFIAENHSNWFLPMFDGKPPLFVWSIAAMLKLFPADMYLAAGRFTSILFGYITMLGIYKLSAKLTQFFTFTFFLFPFTSSLLYIFSPFTLFYDRMALFDTPLSAALIWSVIFWIQMADKQTWKSALLAGLSLGIAFYMKPTALIFWFLLPIIVFLLQPLKKPKILLITIALFISMVISQSMRISSTYPSFTAKNAQFQIPITELLNNPFSALSGNLPTVVSWIWSWYTPPVFLFGILSLILLTIQNRRIGAIFLLLTVVPVISLSAIGREIFPRYFLFISPYLSISIALCVSRLTAPPALPAGRLLPFTFLLIIGLSVIPFDYSIVTNPPQARLPITDYEQYISSHPSGYGIDQTYKIIDQKVAENGFTTVVTEGTFGLYPYAYTLKYWHDQRVTIIPLWPYKEIASQGPTLEAGTVIIFKDHDTFPENPQWQFVEKIDKPYSDRSPIFVGHIIR